MHCRELFIYNSKCGWDRAFHQFVNSIYIDCTFRLDSITLLSYFLFVQQIYNFSHFRAESLWFSFFFFLSNLATQMLCLTSPSINEDARVAEVYLHLKEKKIKRMNKKNYHKYQIDMIHCMQFQTEATKFKAMISIRIDHIYALFPPYSATIRSKNKARQNGQLNKKRNNKNKIKTNHNIWVVKCSTMFQWRLYICLTAENYVQAETSSKIQFRNKVWSISLIAFMELFCAAFTGYFVFAEYVCVCARDYWTLSIYPLHQNAVTHWPSTYADERKLLTMYLTIKFL